jgi:C1A family cysteine protease
MQYVAKFGKNYANIEEFEQRLEVFTEKHTFIQAHDVEATGYALAHNQFSDWTQAEYKAILTYQPMGEYYPEEEEFEANLGSTPKDWRSSGCLNAIKDQGQCGSCWAFSGIATTENYWCTNQGKLYSLSEQQQVDCNTGCYGCNGGWAYKVWTYLEKKYAESESSYPYKARDGTCKYSSSSATPVSTSGYSNVKSRSPSSMQSQLAHGILSVAIQADQRVFQLYSSGIFTNTSCGTNLDHATNVVGWGT